MLDHKTNPNRSFASKRNEMITVNASAYATTLVANHGINGVAIGEFHSVEIQLCHNVHVGRIFAVVNSHVVLCRGSDGLGV